MQNAPGAANGAALCLIHIRKLLQKLRREFPGARILVRGDTGYNNTELIEILEEEGVSYVVGYNVQGKTMKKGLFAHIAEMYAAAPPVRP